MIMTKQEKFDSLMQDETLCKELQTMTDAEEVRALLAKNGLEFTQEEMTDILMSVGQLIDENLPEGELDEDVLENVHGGITGMIALGAGAKALCLVAGIGVGALGVFALGCCAYKLYKWAKK